MMGGILSTSSASTDSRRLLADGQLNKRMLSTLLDENEPIRLSLDDQAFVFLDGAWLPDFSSRDYRKLSKQNQLLVAENGLLKVKVDILLELITARTASGPPKKLLTHRRNSVKTLHTGYSAETSASNIDLVMHDRKSDLKVTSNPTDLQGSLFAIGDPLLDIIAEVPNSVLEKHFLDPDSGVLMGEAQNGLADELLNGRYKIDYVPGGSEQNCLKVVQHLIGVPHATTYLGCIGKDRNGEILENAMKACGINVRYQYCDGEPTGICYICFTGAKRSLVTSLGAAQRPLLDLLTMPENWSLVEKAKYYYVEAYSVANRFEEMILIAKHALEHNKVFSMNLSSSYLSSTFKEKLLNALPYVDLLFGSEVEALAFGAAHGLNTTEIGDIALNLARKPKENGRRGRLVILTRGKNPAIAVSNGQVRLFPVIPTAAEDIQDTVGAGDSFAGGYLAALITGHKHDECMRAALEAAHFVIRCRGCELLPNFNQSVGLNLSPDATDLAK